MMADQYPVPHIQDLSVHLHGCKVFSKVDLIRGYHQVPMHPDDIPKTAVITTFGLFESSACRLVSRTRPRLSSG